MQRRAYGGSVSFKATALEEVDDQKSRASLDFFVVESIGRFVEEASSPLVKEREARYI